ncbi:hypothetical protein SAMN04487866_10420 [Thermoactinomyces sp. DSM 45891]|uniref:hypothetical protein n=1 Tax=Thermoactinomyces sp. DSM 45891 TaxID=1761907 RepID=UPI000920037D|nr:hypothetical protein [Thermoactinomyces sp. DSM 45891]SFX30279.1 hypothetical protein SAMN04487866_10420 [Thermoactinomyces sp. DSM 45891]
MKKLIGTICLVALAVYITPTVNANEVQTKKPSGNFCGKDGWKGKEMDEVPSFIPQTESPDISNEDKAKVDPQLFDKFKVNSTSNVCGMPTTLVEYINKSAPKVTHKFSETATKSTTFNIGVNGNFHEAFQASLGYSATNTVTRTVELSVELKKGESCKIQIRPSLHAISGTWSYFTGSKGVDVYYPTHLTWIASKA